VVGPARQGQTIDGLVCGHFKAAQAADWFATIGSHWGFQQQAIVAGEQFAYPAAPDDSKASLEEKAVAGVCGRAGIVAPRGAVEHTQGQLVAPIIHIVKQRPIPARRILGSKDENVRLELDQPLGISRRLVEIDNHLVAGMLGIDGEMGHGTNLDIRPRRTERGSAGKLLRAKVLEPDQLGGGRRYGCDNEKHGQQMAVHGGASRCS